MGNRQLMLTFPHDLVREPIIYNLGQQFRVITNVRRADVAADRGWVVVELEGEDADIEDGITWLTGKGVRVDSVIGDVVEG